jgi:hypothetical protein
MTTIHDTIYPRLKAIVSPQDLEQVYTPTPEECALAAEVAQDRDHFKPGADHQRIVAALPSSRQNDGRERGLGYLLGARLSHYGGPA